MGRPKRRAGFLGPADELNYLNDLVLWLNANRGLDRNTGRRALVRYRVLLDAAGLDDGSILLQEHWATYYEVTSAFTHAAAHRDRQVELVESLFRIGGPIAPIDHAYLDRARLAAAHDRKRACDKP